MNNFETTIVHISDPHFGTEDKTITQSLIESINKENPDLIIISGDLTQRALKQQFLKAKNLIDSLNAPKIVIPGNHDIPLFNLFKRFVNPLSKFQKFISSDQYPEYTSDRLAIVGVNTSTPFHSQAGRIRDEDIEYLKKYFSLVESPQIIKGVVVHHNIIPYENLKGSSVLGNYKKFIDEMNKCGVDLIFAGHLHKSIIKNYNNTLLLQAGTCISKRLRHEKNTYLVIETGDEKITVSSRVYKESRFTEINKSTYARFR